jgi:hypothetical protein
MEVVLTFSMVDGVLEVDVGVDVHGGVGRRMRKAFSMAMLEAVGRQIRGDGVGRSRKHGRLAGASSCDSEGASAVFGRVAMSRNINGGRLASERHGDAGNGDLGSHDCGWQGVSELDGTGDESDVRMAEIRGRR